ncbi:MAG: glyoxalase [Actinobacteria bacterium 13_1_20CM_3_71_11]|jgi:predicted enzyme related to lactoylglutathione lyase|nr:MAG: glyoxalase [Actinobacteria bacterium 13_1_20CM_3_71_11]
MASGFQLIVFPVSDAARGKALFQTLLGVEPYVDQPYYVGFRVGDQEIGLDPNGHKQGQTGPIGYHDVEDIHKAVAALVDAGAEVQRQPGDVGGGKLIAWVRDPDGNVIGLAQSPA